ncbi:MAG: CusA/CzcA family heavy metal efflux RND transporter, partial [Chitinophagaceae bacterium]
AYFIRGVGLITTLEDVSRIVVKNTTGIPVLIGDVANVRFGSAVRYGAMTHNGEHEVVGGIVMMLKGNNSADVVARVKERLETIKKSLPADVEIEPFLDRTSLVKRAMSTVKRNLIEGALIVIFVLVLFLGNFRAGLIVASAIPLALLFALGMMNVFGVSANLMSLGAIDFGLIVDGAVIIVEATMHHLALRKGSGRLTQSQMNDEVFESASKIRNSAAFGEIIILIVYIPILTLVGIEGKMFRPMAQTVAFAILGALLLSLTYIPMMCALFLPKTLGHKRNLADRMMDFFQRLYIPALRWTIRMKYLIVGLSVAVMVLTVLMFSRLGGEFIPQLQEGDYAFHCILPQGSSLAQSIETSMQASRIIKSFPEVKDVVGKTGSAEVPTDPMPPEASDLIVVLKDPKEWTSTKDYNVLARMMEEKLEDIPGVFFEANQPIQMRFNELMTGVRQDVAIKIFGENIDTLAALAPRIASVVSSVEGATEPQIERTAGLPQITIVYDRRRIASYGLNIADVNKVVSTAFAGGVAGVVFENERKFDLVVRLDSANRSSIEDVANLFIPTSSGAQIPLSQVATVSFKEGPAQISREDAKRRVVVGFNVQGRDVQSVVTDIQAKLNRSNILPTGYYMTYGGTFENLEQASARLRIAVPIALLLIFALLYFTFHSFKQATLIFTAIPMSAIGGVFALVLREMPFSISAGVGFIALFGVAVLNGIVLIGTFNQLEKDGMTNVLARVIEGTKIRLRPVLMTATVASLGFLPMALSSGAGAEVQKPLASVVIGGLVTATLLTLFVLPLLYIIFSKPKPMNPTVLPKVATLLCALLLSPALFAQDGRITFPQAFDTALRNNLQLRASDLQIERSRALAGSGYAIPRTGVFVENEDINPEDRKGILKIGVAQSLDWPGLYKAQRNLLQQQVGVVEAARRVRVLEIRRDLEAAYYQIWYLQSKQELWRRLDTLYSSFARAASLRVRTGESAGLDSLSASARARETQAQLGLLQRDIQSAQEVLKRVLNTGTAYLPPLTPVEKVATPTQPDSLSAHPSLQLQQQNIQIAAAELSVQRQSNKPSFEGRFFSQRLYGISNPYSGFSVTVGIPIFGRGAYRSKVQAAQIERQYQESVMNYDRLALATAYSQGLHQLKKDQELLRYYEESGLAQAEAIIKAANLAYRGGEINFNDLSQYLTQAIDIKKAYLDILNSYNQSAIQVNYYLNR